MRTLATRFLWRFTLALMVFCAMAWRVNAATFVWDPSPDAATGKVVGYKFYYSSLNFVSLPVDVATNPAFTIITITNGSSITLSSLVDGQTYFMAVTAFDANGQESVPSNILTYTVGQVLPPLTVAITDPASALSVSSTSSVTVTATATGPVAINKVDLFDGALLIGTKTSAPYTFSQIFSVGAHVLTAKATDANNTTAVSAPVTITSTAPLPLNVPPTISLIGLNSGALLSQPVVLNASASDPDGRVASVEFFANNTSLGVSTTQPYTISVPMVSGAYTFTARATDNSGAVSVSAPVTATVKPPPPANLTIN